MKSNTKVATVSTPKCIALLNERIAKHKENLERLQQLAVNAWIDGDVQEYLIREGQIQRLVA